MCSRSGTASGTASGVSVRDKDLALTARCEEMSTLRKRIGIIGAGQIVEDCHLPVLANIGAVTVSWVTDSRVDRSRLLSRMYRVPYITTDEVVERIRDVDICLLAIPVGARKEHIEMCAEAGVALYAEKPFARSQAEHASYAALFPVHRLAAGFQRRFYRSVGTLRRIIEDKVFGELVRIEHSFGQYSLRSGGSERFIARPELAGGGVLIEAGIHGLDQILFATRADSVKVEQTEALLFDRLDYDVVVDSVIVRGQQEVPVRGEFSRLRNLRQTSVYYFETATVFLGVNPGDPLKVRTPALSQTTGYEITSVDGAACLATTVNQAMYCFWLEFLRSIEGGRPNATSASSSYLTTVWLEGIDRMMAG